MIVEIQTSIKFIFVILLENSIYVLSVDMHANTYNEQIKIESFFVGFYYIQVMLKYFQLKWFPMKPQNLE